MEHREIEDAPEPDTPTVTPETTLSPIVKLRVFILLGSMFIAIVDIAFVVPFLPVLASELGATGVALGLIMAAFSISSSVTQPLAGYFSDKLGRKRFLALGMAIYSIGGFLYVAGSSVTDIVLVRFLQLWSDCFGITASFSLRHISPWVLSRRFLPHNSWCNY